MSKMPPASGLIVIAERIVPCGSAGVAASSSARSQALATSMLNVQVSGAPGSAPPMRPSPRRSARRSDGHRSSRCSPGARRAADVARAIASPTTRVEDARVDDRAAVRGACSGS